MNTPGWAKGIVSWEVEKTLFLSIPFTWLLPQAKRMAEDHDGRVVAGGPAVALAGAPWAETATDTPYDVLSMHNPFATFTTRGCPNRCKFCAVPKIEGAFRELHEWKAAPIICDNNLLAASRAHFEKVIDSLTAFGWCDFNQALDARLFSRWHADQIRRVKRPKVRFSCDAMEDVPALERAIDTSRSAGLPKPTVYALIGWNDTPAEARDRLQHIVALGAEPFPMRFQPLDALKRNAHVAPGWTHLELVRTQRYFANLRYFRSVPFDEFEYPVAVADDHSAAGGGTA